jgi:hypothetical protein
MFRPYSSRYGWGKTLAVIFANSLKQGIIKKEASVPGG